jgi:hypothetical protein
MANFADELFARRLSHHALIFTADDRHQASSGQAALRPVHRGMPHWL